MRDLIERQKAIRKLKRMATQAYIDNLNGSAETVINCCIDIIERQIPSAQPEIIYCKNCKYCDRGIDEDGNPFLKCLGWVYGGTQEEDFCSHAERRTDD